MTNEAASIVGAVSTAGAHLGDIVFLRLFHAARPRTEIGRVATRVMLDMTLLPDGLNRKQAFQLAMRELRIDDHILRQMDEDSDHIGWAVVREDAPSNMNRDYSVANKVFFDKNAERLTFEDPAGAHCLQVMTAYNDRIDLVTSTALRGMVQKFARESHGIQIGTEFFVPNQTETLRAMRRLITDLGDSEMWLLPIHDSDDSRESLGAAIRSSIEDDLAKIASDMESFNKDTRRFALERRLKKFDELRSQAKLYEGMLEIAYTDIGQRIRDMETHVNDLILQKDADDSTARASA